MYLTELCELNQNSVPPDKGKTPLLIYLYELFMINLAKRQFVHFVY
ncbi:hypothetical protein [Klebsiella pneumoniae IS43]|uniref:Uncharacterized protein n=1 Tax=Klebsiella pneumoniae IS43 TaxID=1432552 RepID=W1DWI5_KLEPN|nr:hypothetical protein [Klebsiella pneumoniae IS43]CDL63441.1 hypothetical protein [Klebsiella pneumoniae IS39]